MDLAGRGRIRALQVVLVRVRRSLPTLDRGSCQRNRRVPSEATSCDLRSWLGSKRRKVLAAGVRVAHAQPSRQWLSRTGASMGRGPSYLVITLGLLFLVGCTRKPLEPLVPAHIGDVEVASVSQTTVTIVWTSPTATGPGASDYVYDVRYLSEPLTEALWGTASQAAGEPSPSAPGTHQSFEIRDLTPGKVYYVAIRCVTNAGLSNGLSNVISASTHEANPSIPIYVATDGQDTGDGSPQNPMQTIAAGIDRARVLGKKLVCIASGTYLETIQLSAGIDIKGGFNRQDGWSRDLSRDTTVIAATLQYRGIWVVIVGEGISQSTVVDGLKIVAPSPPAGSGASTIALYLDHCPGITVSNSVLVCGTGGSGADRGPGPQGVLGAGGAGGSGGVSGAGSGGCNPGSEDGAAGTSVGAASGGRGGPRCVCSGGSSNGQDGGQGQAGSPGSGGVDGSWAQNASGFWTWLGGNGGSGTAGKPGAGGGGAGGGCSFQCPAACRGCSTCWQHGKDGGNGGAGGGGGGPGQGGQAGGASIGFLTIETPCTIQHCTVIGRQGGAGGRGGSGGPGSPGYDGDADYSSCGLICTMRGPIGGSGGRGGVGGDGGGGAGGISYCVYVRNSGAPPSLLDSQLMVGLGGEGGAGGARGAIGAAGDVFPHQ